LFFLVFSIFHSGAVIAPRSAGVPPAPSKAGGTPALRRQPPL
jgi:hypothetical protein